VLKRLLLTKALTTNLGAKAPTTNNLGASAPTINNLGASAPTTNHTKTTMFSKPVSSPIETEKEQQIVISNERLDSLWSDSTIPLTNNAILDQRFVESSRFKHLSHRLLLLNTQLNVVDYSSNKKLGYGNTKAQAGLIGQLGDGKYVIDFDPLITTVLDILHEKHHIIQFQRLANSGALGNKSLFSKYVVAGFERGAYEYERRLALRLKLSQDYQQFLVEQILNYYTITVQRKYESDSKNFQKILNAIEPSLNPTLDRALLLKSRF
jgi:hypothetical protein